MICLGGTKEQRVHFGGGWRVNGGGGVAKAGIIERVGVCCVCPCCGRDLIHPHGN